VRGLPLLVLLLPLGCTSAPPIAKLAFVTPRADLVAPQILRAGVEGEHCFREDVISVSLRPPWLAHLADHGRAVADALARVPDANVLVNARMSVRVEQYLLFQRICAVVHGDAGMLR
jgi:hypothetical protein